jgi:hypothetical protein
MPVISLHSQRGAIENHGRVDAGAAVMEFIARPRGSGKRMSRSPTPARSAERSLSWLATRWTTSFRKLGLIKYNGHIEVHGALLDAVLREKPQLKED